MTKRMHSATLFQRRKMREAHIFSDHLMEVVALRERKKRSDMAHKHDVRIDWRTTVFQIINDRPADLIGKRKDNRSAGFGLRKGNLCACALSLNEANFA